LSYQSAEDLIQAVAGYLGIQLKAAADSNPAYPKPNNIGGGSAAYAGAQEVTAGAQSLYSAGTDQTNPRFISGLPFDDPLSTGGFGNRKENAVWVERSTNSLMVRATPREHDGLAEQIRVWDREENQIQINTYVIEVAKNDDLFGGVDWSNTLGQNGATFTLTGNVGATPVGITSAGFGGPFFNNGLILKFPDVAATIRALTQRGKLRSTNSPITFTKTAVPVQIRSVTQQTIFLQTAATANVQATTTPYTFTTGLTIDLVGRILKGGIIDLKINPALSTQTGQSPAQPGTNTTVPIVSTRTATADVQVRSGDAAVIGGITQDVDNYTENGLPGVRKLPIVGYLFSSRQKMRDRTNLVIIVWPRIIKGTMTRRDRAGSDEEEMLGNMTDLPGEPPPGSYGRDGKQAHQ
jgi:general secretion pathway protein D